MCISLIQEARRLGASDLHLTAGGAPVDAQSIGRLGGEEEKQESSVTKNARTRVAESTQPR